MSTQIFNGQVVDYIGPTGKIISAQVERQRLDPVTNRATVATVGMVRTFSLMAIRGDFKGITEGEELTVIAGHSDAVRGTIVVSKLKPAEGGGGACFEGAVPAGTQPGDTLARVEIIHNEPLLSLAYTDPVSLRRIHLYDVVHFSHPSKDEANPALPRIVLHAWKRQDEDAVAPSSDHPVHDHPFEVAKTDDMGHVLQKERPHHEAHVEEHISTLPTADRWDIEDAKDAHAARVSQDRVLHQQIGLTPKAPQKRPAPSVPVEIHPGHAEAVAYDYNCVSCGATVKRLASHQGGAEFEQGGNGDWVKHVCAGPDSMPQGVQGVPSSEDDPMPVHPIEALGGALTMESLAKVLPVVSVLYESPDAIACRYLGTKATLPNGHSHTVSANGFDQDKADVIQFVHVNGFSQHLEDPSVEQYMWLRKQVQEQATQENSASSGDASS
jgi:hypothetical protein